MKKSFTVDSTYNDTRLDKWLRNNILHQNDEDIDRMDKEIDSEIKAGILKSPDEDEM